MKLTEVTHKKGPMSHRFYKKTSTAGDLSHFDLELMFYAPSTSVPELFSWWRWHRLGHCWLKLLVILCWDNAGFVIKTVFIHQHWKQLCMIQLGCVETRLRQLIGQGVQEQNWWVSGNIWETFLLGTYIVTLKIFRHHVKPILVYCQQIWAIITSKLKFVSHGLTLSQ